MLSATIYSILSIPAKPPSASPRSLQWTPDGQLLVLGEFGIYLLTPETGMDLSTNRLHAATTNTNRGMTWLTTAISLQATDLFWPEVSQEWGTLCIGAVDYTWNAVTFSPTGCSDVGSCLLATLSSNLEVYLWAPKGNFYRGEWAKIQDVTRDILTYIRSQGVATAQSILNAQVQTLCWSTQPLTLSQHSRMSLLALGTRAGTVLLLRLQAGGLKVVASAPVASTWITGLAWTKWTRGLAEGTATAQLACALPSGRIVLLNVSQTWGSAEYAVDPVLETAVADERPYRDDRRGITSMEWVDIDGQGDQPSSILVHCKAGTVELWRKEQSSRNRWGGLRFFKLTLESTSTGSTNFAQVAGIIYVPRRNVIVISLMDGSYHTIHQVSTDPILLDQSNDTSLCTSASLSSAARAAFLVSEFQERELPKDGSEPPKLYHNHMARTTGAVAVDSSGVILWIHQKIFFESFEYIPDSKIRCLLVTAPLISPSDYDQCAMEEMKACLENPTNFLLDSPSAILRGVNVHLRRKDFIQRNREAIISLLSPLVTSTISHHEDNSMMEDSGATKKEWATRAGEELSLALFSNEELCKERLKLNMAMICDIACPDISFEKLTQALKESTYAASLLRIFDWLTQLPSSMIRESGSFLASRMLRQASLSPAIRGKDSSIKMVSAMLEEQINDTEQCPACGKVIEFTEISLGKCEDGHYWSRCSATSYILSTPYVKSCVCCGSKVMLSGDLDSTQQGGDKRKDELLTRVLLAAMQNCRLCGNKCVKPR